MSASSQPPAATFSGLVDLASVGLGGRALGVSDEFFAAEGRELSRAELPPYDEAKVMTLPLVWKNPLTGRQALQLHAYCVEDLLVDGQPIGDLETCRSLLYELMRPAIAPDRIYAHAWRDGDLVIFHNRAVWHSVVGSMRPDDLRVYHQCNLAASEPPLA